MLPVANEAVIASGAFFAKPNAFLRLKNRGHASLKASPPPKNKARKLRNC